MDAVLAQLHTESEPVVAEVKAEAVDSSSECNVDVVAALAPPERTPRGASRRTLSLSLDRAGLSLCLSITPDSHSVSRPRWSFSGEMTDPVR